MRQAEQREDPGARDRDAAPAPEWRHVDVPVVIGPSSGLRRRLGSSPIPANLVGAVVIYFYFTFVDPLAANPTLDMLGPFLVFLVVTSTLLFANWYVGRRLLAPLTAWRRRLRLGADPRKVPDAIRRRALNAPLTNAILSATGWTLAGIFYVPYLAWKGVPLSEITRTFVGIVLVGGPITSALAFLLSEFHWRQEIPVFFPYGRIERTGALRVPVLVRLAATFLVTAAMPVLLMLMADLTLVRRAGLISADVRTLLRAQLFIAAATSVVSVAMAFLVARFINRPVQALRTAMARVATGDLGARVPVRSTDELGELNEHFNAMVQDLELGQRARELFGRYVSPGVARAALERGIALGGEVVRATAMFVDLRGFTATTERATPSRVVEMLNEYYALVERVCERYGGVITQFLGDGVVVVFGAPLHPEPNHALQGVRAAVALQHELAARNAARAGESPLVAGIGICTGDMIAGNVGAGDRVTYTIVGDAVNQAARLQVKTRELGTSILLTDSTRQALHDSDGIRLRSCGPVGLKGIGAPVEVFSVDTATS